jgi:hypothetical protein
MKSDGMGNHFTTDIHRRKMCVVKTQSLNSNLHLTIKQNIILHQHILFTKNYVLKQRSTLTISNQIKSHCIKSNEIPHLAASLYDPCVFSA